MSAASRAIYVQVARWFGATLITCSQGNYGKEVPAFAGASGPVGAELRIQKVIDTAALFIACNSHNLNRRLCLQFRRRARD